MVIAQRYTQPPKLVPNYDYIDVEEGTGVVIYYGAHIQDSTGVSYALTPRKVYSDEIVTRSDDFSELSFTKQLDLDFDVSFNRPKRLRGTMLFNIPYALYRQTTEISGYVIIKVRKYDGTTETEIDSVQSETLTTTSNFERKYLLMKIKLSGSTHFKKGDTLRITVECWAKEDSGTPAGVHYVFLGHDPNGRTSYEDPDITADPFPATGDYAVIPILACHIPFDLRD